MIGIDPGIRTGCKAVLLNKNGEFLESTVLFLNQKEIETKKVIPWIEKYNVKVISIGDGTLGRETLAIIKICKHKRNYCC